MSTCAPQTAALPPAAAHAATLVGDLVAALGLAEVGSVSPAAFAGRNHTWVMTLADATPVFVKQFTAQAGAAQGFERSLAYDSFAAEHPRHAPRSPRLLGHDAEAGLLVFEHAPGRSLAHLVVEEKLPAGFAADAGELVAGLHLAPADGVQPTDAALPGLDMLRHGIPRSRYLDFTLAEIRLWGRLQQDTELIDAAAGLARDTGGAPQVPIHGDLRLDQFHHDGRHPWLLDWEYFGLGDPARDLGALAGEWLYRAVLDTVTTRGSAPAPPEHFDQASATALIATRMTEVVPHVRAFWSGYRRRRPGTDAGLGLRATAWLGWHLVDRVIARAAMVSTLSGIERAALGIGRRALLDPAAYHDALGFGENHHDGN